MTILYVILSVKQHDDDDEGIFKDDSDAGEDYDDDKIYHLYTRFPKVDTESVCIPGVGV